MKVHEGVTGGQQMVMSVNTGEAPAAIQALPGADFAERFAIPSTVEPSPAPPVPVTKLPKHIDPEEVAASAAGKVFDAIDLGADISALGLVTVRVHR